jgi:thiamine biosynthesis lipoprotein
MTTNAGTTWQRRARPLLGTLVEIGLPARQARHFDAAFAAVLEVQRCLSRFDADSDIARFNALRCGAWSLARPVTQAVLAAATDLQRVSSGVFDISLGTAPAGWRCEAGRLHKLDGRVRLDLGGIGKGHAVDCAVQVLREQGCEAGWVNAGGDLRAFGDVEVPVQLRDEARGGVRPFAWLRDGAFASSHYGPGTRSQLASAGAKSPAAHVSVAAPKCLWADALTKVVATNRDVGEATLARYGATAWRH